MGLVGNVLSLAQPQLVVTLRVRVRLRRQSKAKLSYPDRGQMKNCTNTVALDSDSSPANGVRGNHGYLRSRLSRKAANLSAVSSLCAQSSWRSASTLCTGSDAKLEARFASKYALLSPRVNTGMLKVIEFESEAQPMMAPKACMHMHKS